MPFDNRFWPAAYTWIGRRLKRLGASRAVAFNILSQGWLALSGPLTLAAIAKWFNPVEQGFYYTFNSALTLQIFVELGLGTVLIQCASHEWAHLRLSADGTVTGEKCHRERLGGLIKFATKWYLSASVIVTLGLSIGGFAFFSLANETEVEWKVPWLLISGLTGLSLLLTPALAIVEGCNQVASIFAFRFLQGVASSLTVIASIAAGAGLYAMVFGALMRLVVTIAYLIWRQRNLIRSLLQHGVESSISWRNEIWPLQWRIGISWLSGYFIFTLVTPALFLYHGPIVAGQMGMTWALVTAIETISLPWTSTRFPQLGMMAAKREYEQLDYLFIKSARATVAVAITCALGILLALYYIHSMEADVGSRLLPLLPAGLLVVHRILNVIVAIAALFMRSHKQEPMVVTYLVAALLSGVMTPILADKHGPLGLTLGLLAVMILWVLPSTYLASRTFLRRRSIGKAQLD